MAIIENMNEIVLGGRRLERVEVMMARLEVSDGQLYAWYRQGLPKPLKIGTKRFFDPQIVDSWLLSQIPQNNVPVK